MEAVMNDVIKIYKPIVAPVLQIRYTRKLVKYDDLIFEFFPIQNDPCRNYYHQLLNEQCYIAWKATKSLTVSVK